MMVWTKEITLSLRLQLQIMPTWRGYAVAAVVASKLENKHLPCRLAQNIMVKTSSERL